VETYTDVDADQRLTLEELGGVTALAGGSPPAGPAFQLASPAPSPAREEAWLRFAIPSTAHVRLAIYDVRGRLVTTLVDAIEPAGWHRVSWDRRNSHGARVAPGVYVASLEALARASAHKLVVLP
jgi:hypothetical protein